MEDLLPRASLAALGPRGCVWRRCFYWLWRNRGFRISRAAKPDPRVGDKRPTRLSDPGAFVGPNLNFQGTASPIVRMADHSERKGLSLMIGPPFRPLVSPSTRGARFRLAMPAFKPVCSGVNARAESLPRLAGLPRQSAAGLEPVDE